MGSATWRPEANCTLRDCWPCTMRNGTSWRERFTITTTSARATGTRNRLHASSTIHSQFAAAWRGIRIRRETVMWSDDSRSSRGTCAHRARLKWRPDAGGRRASRRAAAQPLSPMNARSGPTPTTHHIPGSSRSHPSVAGLTRCPSPHGGSGIVAWEALVLGKQGGRCGLPEAGPRGFHRPEGNHSSATTW